MQLFFENILSLGANTGFGNEEVAAPGRTCQSASGYFRKGAGNREDAMRRREEAGGGVLYTYVLELNLKVVSGRT
jgi:hypothetical protein